MKLTKQYGYRISQGTGKTWSNLLILTVGVLKKFNKLEVVKQRSLFRFVAFLHTAESHL